MREAAVRFIVKHPVWTLWGLGFIVILGAAVTVLSGIAPIKASSGHWAITAALLDFAKVRSVATHSWGIKSPALDDEALILRGAGHYDVGCASCHGRPGVAMPPEMSAMTPPPPELTSKIPRWSAEELFTIVKHGIKFTGMPAWPVQQRDDEVWAVVAFLRRMPDLDAAAYKRLAQGDADVLSDVLPSPFDIDAPPAPRVVRDMCWRCHGVDGTGRGPGAFPSLAGQRGAYLHVSMQAFRDRTRLSGIMSTVAAKLTDDDMREIAEYYERLPRRAADTLEHPSNAEEIATRGVPDRDIPACAECHGPTTTPKNPQYPRIDGQHARYLTLQLELLQARRRGGPNVNLMETFVHRLQKAEIDSLARYFASIR